MKKNGILNVQLSKVIARLGHGDKLVICDCGLPIPKDAEIVDLVLVKGVPTFRQVLKAVLKEVQVEKVIYVEEFEKVSKALFDEMKNLIQAVEHICIAHEKFKEETKCGDNVVFVRTGEATPYANIILVSGVSF